MRNTDWSCLDFFKPARKTKKNMIKRMKLLLVDDVRIKSSPLVILTCIFSSHFFIYFFRNYKENLFHYHFFYSHVFLA